MRGFNHGTHRLARLQPLSDDHVHMGKAGQHRMIAAAVLYYQYLPVGPERPFEHDLAIERGHHLGAGAGGDDHPLAFAEGFGALPEFCRNLPPRRPDQAARLPGKGGQVGRRGLQPHRRGRKALHRGHLFAAVGGSLAPILFLSGRLFLRGCQPLRLFFRRFSRLPGGLGVCGLLPRLLFGARRLQPLEQLLEALRLIGQLDLTLLALLALRQGRLLELGLFLEQGSQMHVLLGEPVDRGGELFLTGGRHLAQLLDLGQVALQLPGALIQRLARRRHQDGGPRLVDRRTIGEEGCRCRPER